LEAKLASLEAELAAVKADLKKQSKKINEVKAHDAQDNIKWGADVRTSIDNINYDMADGTSAGKEDLMALRLWLNMAYAPDSHNIFKGQLSMNKAFGADFANPINRTFSMGGMMDWTSNEALTDNSLKVRQAYWLYMGDNFLGADMPWTFSLGRRPSTNGFLANLRDDDTAQSPLGHIINLEFDGLSSKLDLSKVTGVPGMSIKLCMGQGSTNAQPMFETPTQYANGDFSGIEDIKLAGFIFEPYNDGQIVTKATWFRAYDLPGQDVAPTDEAGDTPDINSTNMYMTSSGFNQYGDMEGGAFSVLIDGLTEDGYLSGAKLFGSVAYSKSRPNAGSAMMGSAESETGTSYWFGTQLPVAEDGKLGLEYNHGSQYWRPFTYAEDTMIGSKLAARGDAMEAYFTWNFSEALSAQLRYTKIDYDYAGSNGFFGNFSGTATKIDDLKDGAANWDTYSGGADATDLSAIMSVATTMGYNPELTEGDEGYSASQTALANAQNMAGAAQFLPNIVEAAQDLRFYIRYRF
jgi:hypothetical protein